MYVCCTASINGILIGELPHEAHNVSGEFYIADNNTFVIYNFNYDGEGDGS